MKKPLFFSYKNRFFILGMSTILFSAFSFAGNLIPAEDSQFYYRIGGGQDFPMPANLDTTNVNLNVTNDLGLGYNCGSFSPFVSITNTLNDAKNSFESIDKNIVQYATSAISQFAMYELARADPNAFNLLNNNLIGAHNLFSLSIKSCETMQNDVAKGQNPFTDWVTVSMGHNWKTHMLESAQNNQDQNKADVNKAKQEIEQDNGDTGVPWVGNKNAGGLNQPPVFVIHDTAIAGYNVILNRSETDQSAPAKNDQNVHLVSTWPTPAAAAQWIVNAVGDEKITTCAKCDKGSTPALGLLPANQALAKTVSQNLADLVRGNQSLNEANLEAVSAPGVMVNTDIIRAIQNMSPNQQAIIIGKLGQDVATAQTMDRALLAKRLLKSGSRVPAIYSNHAAQASINRAIAELDHEMQALAFDVDMRRKVVSNTLSDIMQNNQANVAATRATPGVANNAAPVMQDGAIVSKPNQSH